MAKKSNNMKKSSGYDRDNCFQANVDLSNIQLEFKKENSLENLRENLKDFISDYCGKVFTEMSDYNHNSMNELFLECLKNTWNIIPNNFYEILPERPETEYINFDDFKTRFKNNDNYSIKLLNILREQFTYWMRLVFEDLKKNSENIVHYILFWGMTGEGKTTLIAILAQIFNFINPNRNFGKMGIGTTGTKEVPDVLEAFFKHIKLLFQDIPGTGDYGAAISGENSINVSTTLKNLKNKDQHLDTICFVFDISKNRTLCDHENTLIHLAYAFKKEGSKIWNKVVFLFSQANREFEKDTDQIHFLDIWGRDFDINNNNKIKIETKITKCKFKKGKYSEEENDITLDMPDEPLKRWFVKIGNYYKNKFELIETRRKLRIFKEFKSIIEKMFDNSKLYANEIFKNSTEKSKYIDTLIQGLYDRSVYTGYCYDNSGIIDFGKKDFEDGIIKPVPDTKSQIRSFWYRKEILECEEYKESKRILEDLDGKLSKHWISEVIYQIINVSDPDLTLNLGSIYIGGAEAFDKKKEENKKESTKRIPQNFPSKLPRKKLEETARDAVKLKVETTKGTCMDSTKKMITSVFTSKHTLPTVCGAVVGGIATGFVVATAPISVPVLGGAAAGAAVFGGVGFGISKVVRKEKAKPKENKEVEMNEVQA
jgi:hypothetical protein